MTSNFEETSISKNAKRMYSPLTSLTNFEAAVTEFVNDDTMGLTKKEAGDVTYKARIDYSTSAGDDRGYILLYLNDKASYEAMISLLQDESTLVYAAGEGGKAVHSTTHDAWSKKFSCAIGDDTFSVTITREYINVTGFAEDTTLQTLETWADTVEAFGGEAA